MTITLSLFSIFFIAVTADVRYVDSNAEDVDPTNCGDSVAKACISVAQAITTNSGSATVIALVKGDHEQETETFTIDRELNITGNYDNTTECATLYVSYLNTTDSLMTVSSEVRIEQLSLAVVLHSVYVITYSFLQTTSTGSVYLKDFTAYGIQYEKYVLIPIQTTFINAYSGKLTLDHVNFTGLPIHNAPLLTVSTNSTDSFTIISDSNNSSFTNIYRRVGNGSVFSVTLQSTSYFHLHNASFRNCSSPAGYGGAIYINIPTTVDEEHFKLTALSFYQAGNATSGRFVFIAAPSGASELSVSSYRDILADRRTEIYNHFCVMDKDMMVYPLNNF